MEKVDIQQPAIRIEIPASAALSTEAADGFYTMREWQVRCFEKFRDSQNWIINAPMAAGKSFQICAIAADRLRRDEHLKVIIAVPQTIIAAGFRRNKLELPDSTRIEWSVAADHDLCKQTLRQGSARLLKFLQGAASKDMMSRVVLCTHATLVRAFAKNKAAFKSVLLVVDEAHHIRHGGDDGFDVEVENRMGALVKYALQNPELIRLGLTTATFFRGDKAPIVPDPTRFTRFELAYDEYLASCKYLRSFFYNFVIHSSSFADPLARLFDQRIGKTLVYIPSVNSYGSVGSKLEDVEEVLKAIAGTDAPVLADEDQPIMRVKRGETWVRVVNLVDTSLREQKKEAIISAHDKPDADDLDVIIALGMFKEGANWRWADREIIIGQRGSLTEVIQMVGRLFRDVAGKSQVDVYQLLPFALDQTDKASVRESLNGYLKALLLSMLLEDVLDPVLLPPRQGIGKGEGSPRINYLREAFPSHSEAVLVLEEITQRIIDSTSDESSFQRGENFKERFTQIVSGVVAAHDVDECHEEIAEQVLRMFSRRTVALRGLNVGHVDADFISENPFSYFLKYTSEACGIDTFQELRAASRHYASIPFENARSIVRSLGLESLSDWNAYCSSGRKPNDIPSCPKSAYRDKGWAGLRDWLGTDLVRRDFEEARRFVHSLKLKSFTAWRAFCRSGEKPRDIPSGPWRVYRDNGWRGWGDWLGTGTIAWRNRTFRPFREARDFARDLNLKSQDEWKTYCKSDAKPIDIPSYPSNAYKGDGWVSIGDWLGTGTRNFRSFYEARGFVRTLGINSNAEWLDYSKSGKKPKDIPSTPCTVYKDDGWKGLQDWIGTNSTFRPFAEAREFARSLELKTTAEWNDFCRSERRPRDIPYSPRRVYKNDGWKGVGDWLGTGKIGRFRKFRPFAEARQFAHELRLTSATKWGQYCVSGQKPRDIPSTPHVTYKNTGWNGWSDWLGPVPRTSRFSTKPANSFATLPPLRRLNGERSTIQASGQADS